MRQANFWRYDRGQDRSLTGALFAQALHGGSGFETSSTGKGDMAQCWFERPLTTRLTGASVLMIGNQLASKSASRMRECEGLFFEIGGKGYSASLIN